MGKQFYKDNNINKTFTNKLTQLNRNYYNKYIKYKMKYIKLKHNI